MRSHFEEQWRTRFEEFADLCDDDAGIAGWTTTGLDARLRRFLALWRPGEPGGRWLDAGCGAGTYTRVLLRNGHDVVSVDYSMPTLRKATRRGLEGAVFAVADVRELPFRQEQFDGALCFGVTQALASSDTALRELARLLKPGGELWIDALNGRCLVHAFGELQRRALGEPSRLRYESPLRLRRLVEECGLTDVQLYWMPIMPARNRHLQQFVESPRVAWILAHIPLIGLLISHGCIVHARKPG